VDAMSALVDRQYQKEEVEASSKPTGYIAIGLRETDRGLRLVRLFTTETLPCEFENDFAPAIIH